MDAIPVATVTSDRADAPLVAADIEEALARAWPGACAVEAVAITGSTQQDLVATSRAVQPTHCMLRAAGFQTSGRGRQQRLWQAAPGDAVLFSVAVPMADVPPALSTVTLACGVALAECLAEYGVAVRLKWPNDVRVGGQKLAGILSEWVVDRAGRRTLVIGVGVNLRLDTAARDSIAQPAIALDQLLAVSIDRRREPWIGRFGGAVLFTAQQFMRDGFDPFCARFNRLLEARGEMVDVADGGERVISGRIVEVDRYGRLVIDAGDARHNVSVGDVSVRAANR